MSPRKTTSVSRPQAALVERHDQAADQEIQERERGVIRRLHAAEVVARQLAEEARMIMAIGGRHDGRIELSRLVSALPLARECDRGVRLVEGHDHGERTGTWLFHELDREIHHERRFHRAQGQAVMLAPGVQPDRGRILERTPRPCRSPPGGGWRRRARASRAGRSGPGSRVVRVR